MTNRYALSAAVLAIAASAPAQAQTATDRARDTGREVIVTAPLQQSEQDVLQGTSVLTGARLDRELRTTIGETLARLPGVSATSFGPNASRPILRGFQGDRVRVLTDGIGSFDVSNTSVDHAVVINPLLAERIEVLRGPVALLYGTSAVGGVVNVIDTRIPRSVPEAGYRLNGIATYGSAADERSVSAAGDVALGRNFVLHADGSYSKTNDLRIGGRVLSRQARAASLSQVGLPQDTDEPIDFAANAALRDRLPNSASETWNVGVGGAYVADDGSSFGLAYSHYDSLYGVPIRYATEVGQEQEGPRLDIRQDRVDFRAEINAGGAFIDKIRARAGYADYRHFELEESGEIGTSFFNKGVEARVEALQTRRGAWLGASGIQYLSRQFDVVGEEAFLPANDTQQLGVFTLQQLDFGALKAEGGLRYEHSNLRANTFGAETAFFDGTRTFDTLSGSLGASYGLADGIRIGINGSRTARAPSAEELFSNGNHAGTQAYELGNPNFRTEKAWGLEATFHAHGDGFSLDASAYHNWFDNFIYETRVPEAVCAAASLEGEVELPCFQFQQADARYYGFEVDASARLATIGGYAINVDAIGDYVRATVRGRGPVPRIPPLRVLGGIEVQGDRAGARIEAEHVFEQDRIAAFETTTDDYTMVNASLSFRPFPASERTSIIVSANNIFDVNARRHASFLKDFAPLAGRDIRVSLRVGI